MLRKSSVSHWSRSGLVLVNKPSDEDQNYWHNQYIVFFQQPAERERAGLGRLLFRVSLRERAFCCLGQIVLLLFLLCDNIGNHLIVFEVVFWNFLRLGLVVHDVSLYMPGFGLLHLDQHCLAQQLFIIREYDLDILLSVSDKLFDIIFFLDFCNQYSLHSAQYMRTLVIAVEQGRKFLASWLDVLCIALLHFCRRCSGTRIELAYIQDRKFICLHEIHGVFELLIRFSWKPTNYICCNCDPWHITFQVINNLHKFLHLVLSVHILQHFVVSRLYTNMQELIDLGMIQYRDHILDVLPHVRWVCHAESDHDVFRQGLHYSVEEVRDVRPDISSVCSRVLTGYPYFLDSFFAGLFHPVNDDLRTIANQFPSWMLGFAESACA